MPTTLKDLEEQEKLIRQRGAKATRLSGMGSTFMANVREELRKRAQEKGVSELGKQAAAARKEFAAAPARIREEYKGIDPYKRMSAVAERRGSILAELQEIADLKAQRQASITDILEGMKGGIEAEAAREAQRFTMEQQLYQNMFGRYQLELENTWKQKQFEQASERIEIDRNYNDMMIAIQEGNLELANKKFDEAKRHELVAEQLDRDRMALEEELTYAQLATQKQIAGMKISGQTPPAPTYSAEIGGQTITGLTPLQKLKWEAGLKEEADKRSAISNMISMWKIEGLPLEEIAKRLEEKGYAPAEFAEELAGYQPQPQKQPGLRGMWSSFWSSFWNR